MIISLFKNKPFSWNKFTLSSVVAAIITGIDNKREYLEASKRLKPIYNPAVITMPDLLVPGIIASVWTMPNTSASFKFKLLKILLEIKNIKRFLVPLNPKLMMIPAFFLQNLPKPPFTVDQMILLKTDNILKNGLPGLKDLGVKISDMQTELIKIYK